MSVANLFGQLCNCQDKCLPLPVSPASGGEGGALPASGEGWGGEGFRVFFHSMRGGKA